MARIYASSGGGIRIGATFGALLEGETQQKFSPTAFDFYTGTSAGAFDAALTANGWTAEQKREMFLNTDFGKMFTPFGMPFNFRKILALHWPISLSGLGKFYKSLCKQNPFGPPLEFKSNLLINSVDVEENIGIAYCKEIPHWVTTEQDPKNGKPYSYRTSHDGKRHKVIRWEVNNTPLELALIRSASLPGLVSDHERYMDGGIWENPLLSTLPRDASIFLMHLGYAGLVPQGSNTIPKSIIDRFLYSYEFKNYSFAEHILEHFDNVTAIYPKIYDVDTAAFNMSRSDKEKLLARARANTKDQWSTSP